VYRLLFHPKVEKQLSKIPRPYAERIAEAIRNLKNDPRPPQIVHLDQEMYRLRVGDYRVIYAVFDDDQTIYIGKIARRTKTTYRDVNLILKRARQALKRD